MFMIYDCVYGRLSLLFVVSYFYSIIIILQLIKKYRIFLKKKQYMIEVFQYYFEFEIHAIMVRQSTSKKRWRSC